MLMYEQRGEIGVCIPLTPLPCGIQERSSIGRGFTHRCLSRLYRQPIAVDRVHSPRGHVVIDGSAGTIA